MSGGDDWLLGRESWRRENYDHRKNYLGGAP